MNPKLKNSSLALSAAGLALLVVALLADAVAPSPRAETLVEQRGDSALQRAGRRIALPYFSFARGFRRIGG